MKIKLILALGLLLATGAVQRLVAAEGITGNINGYLGSKSLDDDDWGPNDDQLAMGASLDFSKGTWPINMVIEGITSGDSNDTAGIDVTSHVTELAVGVRKYWDVAPAVSFYGGGGPALLIGSIELSGSALNSSDVLVNVDDEDSGTGLGLWIGGGAVFHITPKINLGVNIRQSFGEVEIFDTDLEAGGLLINALAGVRF